MVIIPSSVIASTAMYDDGKAKLVRVDLPHDVAA